jgi:PhzF family phenazine biosynthesis protein
MQQRRFWQVDVFGAAAYRGNPLAVVADGVGLTDEEMQRFASWTNLSETTFVLPPTDPGADYLVRIFTPSLELPFAGHPTLGTCHVWLAAGGQPREPDVVVQQCGMGLVPLRRGGDRWAFAAPPLVRSGPLEAEVRERLAAALRIDAAVIVDAAWVDNGPGWAAVLLADVDAVLAIEPGPVDIPVGAVALYPPGSPQDIEVRAFVPAGGATVEDPVTGSLNASVAQWLLGNGRLTAPYVARQGTALGRAGLVHVTADDDAIWIGGATTTAITGTVEL